MTLPIAGCAPASALDTSRHAASNDDVSIDANLIAEVASAVKRSVGRTRLTRTEREDLEQATWVRLLECLRDAPEISSLAAFATGVAKNVVREHVRIHQRREALERCYASDLRDASAAPHPLPVDVAYEIRESVGRVTRAKSSLAPSERWLIDARFVEGASYAQILPVFGTTFTRCIRTEQGLRTALFHARDRLRIALIAAERHA